MNKRSTTNYKQLPYNPNLKQKAAALRKSGNLSEVLLWQKLNKRQLLGLDFDRQKIIGNYIVDFYCPQKLTIIEIDGESHNEKGDYDAARDSFLQSIGLKVIHILDIEVKKNLDGVIAFLSQELS